MPLMVLPVVWASAMVKFLRQAFVMAGGGDLECLGDKRVFFKDCGFDLI